MHKKAERLKKVTSIKQAAVSPEVAHRVPPGQTVTERFPILHEGEVPEYDINSWSLRVFGEVEEERTFSFEELLALPQTKTVCDIHCVTRWSKLDTEWEGIKFKDLMQLLKVKPDAQYAMIHADEDYDTNVPLADLLEENVLLAHRFDGEPLTDKHGWPMRLLVPHLYFWKSAKWITGIEFMKEDREGFWERNGFHNYADPFKEQRFSSEENEMPEDEWLKKEFD
ncbi:DMSO/TMAO reductase YedYZ molybdopterin-dependent catalytic subunit [Paenibacillus endophyticus]|uniref:DMSO/TMAO reductase YedYZ molybdopterin-dependent catalytic subunit n=1 Tax=Paenibacillus endophyticus TaxID=1294268 RepID=A0A7W5G855_9BACL|nr:sulfite oxidase-like oxidoreductase [Paenibacillus endophyticus]MBB3150265.1 DMSO/TMAO reductase YedYZ molybdopterin-dependent catalytic subunit [Paenibacillus endophyticus]